MSRTYRGWVWRAGALGTLCGVAWAAALRAYMTELTPISIVEWFGTFAGVLLPGALTGALLGVAWARGVSGRTRGIGWFALAPLAFAIAPMLEPGALEGLLTAGLGGGAIAVALGAIAGGYAVSGAGPLWARLVCGIPAAALLVGLAAASSLIRPERLTLTEPRGAWASLLAATLVALLMLATSIPFRFIAARSRKTLERPA